MLKINILSLAVLGLVQQAVAQQVPGAGSQLQQLGPVPTQQKAPPEIRIERGTAPATIGVNEEKILVRSLRITGAKAYTEAELIAITGFTPGSELTLNELKAMASRITTHYAKNGYFVGRAFLPAQQIQEGVVTMAVSEGQYGEDRSSQPDQPG